MKTLNLVEAAEFLHMSTSALRQKVREGKIPAAKPAKKWVFLLSDLVEFLKSQQEIVAAQAASTANHLSWHSISAAKSGGLESRHQMDKEYEDLLGLQT